MLMSRNTPTGLPAAASCRKFQVWLYHQHNKRNQPGPTCHSQSKIEIRTSTFKAQISNFLFLIFLFRDYNLSFRKCSGISKISRSIPEFHCQVTMIDGCNNSLSIIRRKTMVPSPRSINRVLPRWVSFALWGIIWCAGSGFSCSGTR